MMLKILTACLESRINPSREMETILQMRIIGESKIKEGFKNTVLSILFENVRIRFKRIYK